MKVEIREVVASYVLDLSDHTVHARITKAVDSKDSFLWDISHYCVGETKLPKPAPIASRSIEEALQQIRKYAEGFVSGYRPDTNQYY
jgi:hypothetical protein